MASIKVTYSLDPDTVSRLERAAERLGVSKRQVVREAVADFEGLLKLAVATPG